MKPIILALDAGNSKTDIAVVDDTGSVLSAVRTGGFRPAVDGLAPALDVLSAGIGQALRDAGDPPVALLSAFLANADLPVEEERYSAELTRWGIAERVVVGNDTLALLRSGAAQPVGVAVVCGAGINCVGLGRDGQQFRFPALGVLTGDWGGGSGLADEVMFAAARSEDGRGPRTALQAAVTAHFQLPTVRSVGEAIHLQQLSRARIHELTPILFSVAEAGDEVAGQLIRRQASEIITMATIALRRLELTQDTVDIVLGGGVLASGQPLLNDPIRAALLAEAPFARITVPTVSPVVGAILLGFDELDLEPELRAAVETAVRAGSGASRPVLVS